MEKELYLNKNTPATKQKQPPPTDSESLDYAYIKVKPIRCYL